MIVFDKGFFAFLVIAATALLTVASDDKETPDNKINCVNKMVDWCDKMKFPEEGQGMSVISFSRYDESNNLTRIFCSSNYAGTNCTKNKSPWFGCSSDNKLTYEGSTLKKDSTDGANDKICDTAHVAFDVLYIQNFSYEPANMTIVNETIKSFVDYIRSIQQFFEDLNKKIFGSSNFYPFGDTEFYHPRDIGYRPGYDSSPDGSDSAEDPSYPTNSGKDDQREKEWQTV